ncbi:uncharacterized protein L203_104171 [Cryptococcus depauperatus CBS 7841]|uniref:Peptidase C14 caspase domain-containing protein n=1 Tax=Cryptococcus depauperatus CBS 7841 TaxID=1295531 RepID=A0AAJ8JUY3_9TREE
MSDYSDEGYYEERDSGLNEDRYSEPRSPARSDHKSSSSSDSSSERSRHSRSGSEKSYRGQEEEKYGRGRQEFSEGLGGLGNAAAIGMVTGMMGNLMGGGGGHGQNRAADTGYADGYGGYPQNNCNHNQNQDYQQGYGNNGYREAGYDYPTGPPPQQYEPTAAGYVAPAPFNAQQPHPYPNANYNYGDSGQRKVQHYGPQFTDPKTGEVAQAYFEYSQCVGKRKALLIGVNYFGSSAELAGCINDVHNVQKFITANYGYRPENIVILTDDMNDPRTMPTRDNIIRAMKWLVSGAERDDALFFHYSGHGTQTEDVNGDEVDDDDEAICPVDYESAGLLIDDDIHELLVTPLPAGCRLTAIFDSCHSATVMDLPYVYSINGTIKEPDLMAEASQGLLSTGMDILKGDTGGIMSSLFGAAKQVWEAKQADEKTKQTKTSPADVIMWAGCRDDQTSADTQEAGKATGAMSYAFIAALNKNPQQTYIQLLNSIREEMKGKYTQKPQLSACHPIDTSLMFVA